MVIAAVDPDESSTGPYATLGIIFSHLEMRLQLGQRRMKSDTRSRRPTDAFSSQPFFVPRSCLPT